MFIVKNRLQGKKLSTNGNAGMSPLMKAFIAMPRLPLLSKLPQIYWSVVLTVFEVPLAVAALLRSPDRAC